MTANPVPLRPGTRFAHRGRWSRRNAARRVSQPVIHAAVVWRAISQSKSLAAPFRRNVAAQPLPGRGRRSPDVVPGRKPPVLTDAARLRSHPCDPAGCLSTACSLAVEKVLRDFFQEW